MRIPLSDSVRCGSTRTWRCMYMSYCMFITSDTHTEAPKTSHEHQCDVFFWYRCRKVRNRGNTALSTVREVRNLWMVYTHASVIFSSDSLQSGICLYSVLFGCRLSDTKVERASVKTDTNQRYFYIYKFMYIVASDYGTKKLNGAVAAVVILNWELTMDTLRKILNKN